MEYMHRPDILAAFDDLGYDFPPEAIPDLVMNIIVNQADGDIVPAGPTDDRCTTRDDCPIPWRTCSTEGFCIEPPDRMDAFSAALVYQAVPCEITGIADE
ncbi:MAG: hypothetical protein JRG91_03105 [Deltaproteobacteria bacterium]|nr:hypothetical protein [Deltaproteobacteria bacterium]